VGKVVRGGDRIGCWPNGYKNDRIVIG
jgi:hypothetical protein